jgi:hypothetical protein
MPARVRSKGQVPRGTRESEYPSPPRKRQREPVAHIVAALPPPRVPIVIPRRAGEARTASLRLGVYCAANNFTQIACHLFIDQSLGVQHMQQSQISDRTGKHRVALNGLILEPGSGEHGDTVKEEQERLKLLTSRRTPRGPSLVGNVTEILTAFDRHACLFCRDGGGLRQCSERSGARE